VSAAARFTAAAAIEVREAFAWHEAQAPGLGAEFLVQMEAAVGRMRSVAHPAPMVYRNVRSTRLFRFPYELFFRVEGDAVTVLGCFHYCWKAPVPSDAVATPVP
jgi:toxin ParE1/3/4